MKRIVKQSQELTVDNVCDRDDLIIAYKVGGKVFILVGVYADGAWDVYYSFHPFVTQGDCKYTSTHLDDTLSAAMVSNEVYAFESDKEFLKWASE